MKIGVTGTRSGMTYDQSLQVEDFFADLPTDEQHELHHGDCVGVDVEVARLAALAGYHVVCHPPLNSELRAYHESDDYRSKDSYFARNRTIVNECDILLVIPFQDEWQPNGGTWYTHDYAKKKGVEFRVLWPEYDMSDNVKQLSNQGR